MKFVACFDFFSTAQNCENKALLVKGIFLTNERFVFLSFENMAEKNCRFGIQDS